MAKRSFTLYIDLNGKAVEMSISEFLAHLSTVDDDSEKENAATDFILNLKEELFMITASGYHFPNCMRFLKDAIATVQNEKWKCARRARQKEGKPQEGNPDIARSTLIISGANKDMNERQTDTDNVSDESFLENEVPSHMNLDPIRSRLSIQSGIPILLEPMVQPDKIGSGSDVLQEVTRRQRMVWSVDLHRKFKFAVEALGGPKEAKPKQIYELLKIDDLTTEQIKSHLQRYRKHLISRGQLHYAPGSSQNMHYANPMLARTRFSLLCMQSGESSNNHMTKAPSKKMI